MNRRLVLAFLAALALVLAAGGTITACFSKPAPNCAFLCGTEGQCPEGYFCATDGACKREGLLDGFDCGFRGPPDAGLPIDSGPDAPIDAPVDAAIDAPVDAAIDAM